MSRRKVDTPKHLFTTWLEYRHTKYGENDTDTMNYMNDKLGRAYKQPNIYRFKMKQNAIPDIVHGLINDDLADMLKWLLKRPDVLVNGCITDYQALSSYLQVGVPDK